MGGHGGLNILPQKKWNVYNWDNRIKVTENEKVVQKVIDKMEKKKKDKSLHDKVRQIKNIYTGTKNLIEEEFNTNIDDKEKNKIFKEVMSRQSMEKRLKVDLFFEKMNTPMNPNQQLKMFDDDVDLNKLINPVDDENKQFTFKESIKNHLSPWWMKKNAEDYEFYKKQEEKNNIDTSEIKLINKKHRKDKKEKKHKKNKKRSDSEDTCDNTKTKLEILRKERLEREKIEKQRISSFINKVKY